MALIGEQFDEADDICGVVVSVRRQDKIALWTKNAANEALQVRTYTLTYVPNFLPSLNCTHLLLDSLCSRY